MSVLLAHEKKGGTNSASSIKAALPQESSDSSDNEEDTEMQAVDTGKKNLARDSNVKTVKSSECQEHNVR